MNLVAKTVQRVYCNELQFVILQLNVKASYYGTIKTLASFLPSFTGAWPGYLKCRRQRESDR